MHILRAIPPVWEEVEIKHIAGTLYFLRYTYAPNLSLPDKGFLEINLLDYLDIVEREGWELKVIERGRGRNKHRALAWVPPLSHLEKRILVTLQRNPDWRCEWGGNCWYNYEKLAEDVRRPLKEVKQATRALARKNVVRLTWLVGSDYMLHGRGYILESPYDC